MTQQQKYDFDLAAPFEVIRSEPAESGRSRLLIECPHCHAQEWAHNWSLAGVGKKCGGCGALHLSYSGTVPLRVAS